MNLEILSTTACALHHQCIKQLYNHNTIPPYPYWLLLLINEYTKFQVRVTTLSAFVERYCCARSVHDEPVPCVYKQATITALQL